jgi:hypothetical protein
VSGILGPSAPPRAGSFSLLKINTKNANKLAYIKEFWRKTLKIKVDSIFGLWYNNNVSEIKQNPS